MTYEVIILGHLHMPLYFIGTFTEYSKVLTYGQIARLAGFSNYSRWVGKVLSHHPGTAALPCHRVVNSQGRTAPHWPGQKSLLAAEGITFQPNGRVDLKRHLWLSIPS